MKYCIVTTTINVPRLLSAYVEDCRHFGHDCVFVVVGDKQTPRAAETYCKTLAKRTGTEIVYMDVLDQERYLARFPELRRYLPYRSVQRRNVGLLYAYERGADVLVTIDDDNFLQTKNFLGAHRLGRSSLDVARARDGWFNVCSFLREKNKREFFHRGTPLEARFMQGGVRMQKKEVYVAVNAGLWLEDPDIDALTRLYFLGNPIRSIAYSRKKNFALAPQTWSPFNSQNTALAREVLPAYFLSPTVGRYDDIFGSYVVRRIADHLGHAVSYGFPLVAQHRNPHNHWKDFLELEATGHRLVGVFTVALRSIRVVGRDYHACYSEIIRSLPKALFSTGKTLTAEERAYFLGYVSGMKVWHATFDRILV
ncbi:MAG: arabinopyranose mutase-like protein [Parcubacteria group bacterium GW2011_GWA2_49_9]|nr:MAG: arabinopyranose mutase-like protein [Parcubacteria group bacterium GW2011_GWA2_49_9]